MAAPLQTLRLRAKDKDEHLVGSQQSLPSPLALWSRSKALRKSILQVPKTPTQIPQVMGPFRLRFGCIVDIRKCRINLC